MKEVIIEFTGDLHSIPKKGSENAAGFDLHADIDYTCLTSSVPLEISDRYNNSYVTLYPETTVLIKTGFKMQLPEGYEAQVRPRSGMALKYGITVGNAPGTIDEDYRGDVGVILINHSHTPYNIVHGDRIAQMVIKKTYDINLIRGVTDDTKRGSGGFGSTGK